MTEDNACDFQLEPYICDLNGNISIEVQDLDSLQPTTVVDCEKGAKVTVRWDIEGKIKAHLCGQWCVCVHLESMGPGPELSVKNPCATLEWEPCNDGGWEYEVVIPQDIDVPAGEDLCADNCGRLYQVGVTLTSRDGCGEPGHIAAYCKGPCIMFYNGTDHPD